MTYEFEHHFEHVLGLVTKYMTKGSKEGVAAAQVHMETLLFMAHNRCGELMDEDHKRTITREIDNIGEAHPELGTITIVLAHLLQEDPKKR